MATIDIDRTPAEIEAIREQLSRLLKSNLFTQSHRQGRFLTYIVEQALAGRAKRLNQYLIGIEVFEREDSFDPTVDSIVRVEAGRLRSKLREYYADIGPDDPLVIELPKGSYEVQFRTASGESSVQNTTSATDKRSIAILPFDNMSNDPEQDYFADGITEDLITDLSKLSGLFVISRHSTFVYRGESVNIKKISKDLGVRYVLEGSVRKSGERLRIAAQLIDAVTDEHLWADRYDRKLDDMFEVQDEVARKIVSALQINLTALEDERLGHKGTDNLDAHDLILQGQEQYYLLDSDGLKNSLTLFSQAIELDANYAAAYVWKARALNFLYHTENNAYKEETIVPALTLVRKAVELDDMLPVAHGVLSHTLMWHKKIEEAIIESKRAVELDPNFADGYMWQSITLSSAGKGEEALESIQHGLRVNPYYRVTYTMAHGMALFALGQYEEALQQFQKSIDRNPNITPSHTYKVAILGLLNRTEEAEVALTEYLRLKPNHNALATFFCDESLNEKFGRGIRLAGYEKGNAMN